MRYIIGIDLGTTNCCVSYVDTESPLWSVQPFLIPQLNEVGYLEGLPTLPSFCYLGEEKENRAFNMPWESNKNYCVGHFALAQGSKIPTRLVQSAKSWLCHSTALRRDKILPVEALEDSLRISPVEASTRYLKQIKEAWNGKFGKNNPDGEFEGQEIILTVPASFDEIARSLSVEAAHKAGILHMTLLEEPQAAFYSWIAQHEKIWLNKLPSGSSVLVIDVGGGTTDFSLIEVQEKEGVRFLKRTAVGDHLLLGGDNMDASIAKFIEQKMLKDGEALTQEKWLQLKNEARRAKEALLGNAEKFTVHLQGTGSNVVTGSISTQLTKKEVSDLLLNGFFGLLPLSQAIQVSKKSALRTIGLPYESDPSILNHLARFLQRAGGAPDFILLNGAALKPLIFQEAIQEALKVWFPEKSPAILETPSLDLAVSKGAAYYGKVRRGKGILIRGGSARGFYLVVNHKNKEIALTLLPAHSEEGSTYEPTESFWVTPNAPVTFKMLYSHTRRGDVSGSLVDITHEDLQPLPPIHTLLRFGKGESAEKIPVKLRITLSPIGTIEVLLKSVHTQHIWNLEFQLRRADGQENHLVVTDKARRDETYDSAAIQPARELLSSIYQGKSNFKSVKLMEGLEKIFERPRLNWPPSLLRSLWDELKVLASKRKTTKELEDRWWNLTGFVLRPGFGCPLDDFRLKDLWKIILEETQSIKNEESLQKWICYRRVAGGLSKGQQMQLMANSLPDNLKGRNAYKNKEELTLYNEKVRALGAFECLETKIKIKVGEALIEKVAGGKNTAADIWALGRLGSRRLLYGSLAYVIPPQKIEQWIEKILKASTLPQEEKISLFKLWARKTGQREIDISPSVLESCLTHLKLTPEVESLKNLFFEEKAWTDEDKEQLFGEKLPVGIFLEN